MPTPRPRTRTPSGTPSDEAPLRRTSCAECYRRKRKCDRRLPCSLCVRYSKQCHYNQFQGRPTKEQVDNLQDQVDQLRRLLTRFMPDVDLDAVVGGDALPEHPVAASSPGVSGTAHGHYQTHTAEDGHHETDQVTHDPTEPTADVPHSATTVTPYPAAIPSHDPTPIHDTQPSPPQTAPQTAPRTATSHIAPQDNSPAFSISQSPLTGRSQPGTVEVFERQPKSAAGYEWNERHKRVAGHDGTASLGSDPDGKGYLGFASGVTLLRILQICAGGSSPDVDETRPPARTPDTQWQPTHHDMEVFIDTYFAEYHMQYPIVHQAIFRAQWNELIPRPPRPQWQLLVDVVLAVGAFCASQPDHVTHYFIERAVRAITVDHLETGSLTLVQGFCLLANLIQKMNKPNASYVYLGIASRMAVGLGLHRELPFWNITPFEREMRRRVWWMLYIIDAGTSVTLGRPILLPMDECDVNMVTNMHDSSFTPSASAIPAAVTERTIYTNLLYQSDFHLHASPLYTQATRASPPTPVETLLMDDQLRHWEETLPEWVQHSAQPGGSRWFDLSRQKLFWRCCNLRIILHRRAFLQRALAGRTLSGPAGEAEMQSAQLCLSNALNAISSTHAFFSARGGVNRFETWYGLHYLFPASFVLLIALHTDFASSHAPAWRAAIHQCRHVLGLMKDEPLAAHYLGVVDHFEPREPPAPQHASTWIDVLQNNATWFGTEQLDKGHLSPSMLPTADLDTLLSLWGSQGM